MEFCANSAESSSTWDCLNYSNYYIETCFLENYEV